ncbi:hypothetical protein [Spirochaeta africana]|nr:hypothetical protein [Spirochaeta africana]
MNVLRGWVLPFLILSGIFIALPAVAEDNDSAADPPEAEQQSLQFDFGLAAGIGVQTFPNPDYDGENGPATFTYQSLRLSPDISIGKLGVGLDLTLNYTFTGDHNTSDGFTVRQEDWVPDADEGRGVLSLYLPKIRYIRWGTVGDPLYASLGTINGASLGNGFILGNYSNAIFFPERRFFGLQVNADGSLLDFPVLGIQTFAANLARMDLFGARVYARPLVYTDIPLLTSAQVGFTAVLDRDPYFIARTTPGSEYFGDDPLIEPDDDALAVVWGMDIRQPLVSNPVLDLAVFADAVAQDQAVGAMLGTGGRLFSFLPFNAQLRFMGDGFQPVYFNRTYDLYRVDRYLVYSGEVDRPGYIGWLANTGVSLLDGGVVFTAGMSGPFRPDSDKGLLPELEAALTIADGILPGLSAHAFYQKEQIGSFEDIVDPVNAVIGARINYHTGPAVITLLYDLRYDPYSSSSSPWQVNSGLETTLSLF